MAILIRLALLLVLALASPAGGGASLRAQDPVPLEYRVKAAYLLNFSRYVEWPAEAFASPAAPVVICVVGSNPFGRELDRAAAGQTSHGRPLVIRQVDNAGRARGCHMAFIGDREWRQEPGSIESLLERGTLTVGESERFARDGGVIGFLPRDGTIRFAVNVAARDRAGVRISSRVLTLATALYAANGREQ